LPAVDQPDTAGGDPGDLGEPLKIPATNTPLASLIRDMASQLHGYYTELIGAQPGIESRWRLVEGNPLLEAGRRVVHAIPDSVPDSKGTPNFPDRGGRLWYILLRASRRAKFEEARPFLIAAAEDLAVWLRELYPNELPHTFVVGDIPLSLRLENLQTILTVPNLSPHLKVGTGTRAVWPADQHPLLYAAVEVLVAIPDAITAPDGTPNFPGVGSAHWPRLKNLVMTTDDSPTQAKRVSDLAWQFRDWLSEHYGEHRLKATGVNVVSSLDTPSENSVNGDRADTRFFDVYLSFNLRDELTVNRLIGELQRHKFTIHFDAARSSQGDDIDSTMRDALRRCRCLLMCVSENGLGKWQKSELESYVSTLPQIDGSQFFERTIPILLPGAGDSHQDLTRWNTQRWFDFRQGLGTAELEQLLAVIQEKINTDRRQ